MLKLIPPISCWRWREHVDGCICIGERAMRPPDYHFLQGNAALASDARESVRTCLKYFLPHADTFQFKTYKF